MGKRLTQIATRTGDDGSTGLGDNTRVSKNSGRPHAMGDVDELNSHLGLLLCEPLPADVRALLVDVLGSDLAGTQAPGGSPQDPSPEHLVAQYLNWRKLSIYGGSNEVQRNIIAKAALGI